MRGGYGNLMSISGACDVRGTVTLLVSVVAKESVSQNLNSVKCTAVVLNAILEARFLS